MKALTKLALAGALSACGCATTSHITNQERPGPAVGNAIGAVGGAVVGNAVGGVVGIGEGAVGAVTDTFDNTTRVVRYWRTETTADGRTIQVPEDYLVDRNGRVIRRVK